VQQADVVVIGSGGLGAATAFSLAARGVDVLLVDKNELASQTSPRAAGLVAHARSTDLMVQVMLMASERIERFSDDTGEPLDWVRSGSLKVARRPEDVAVLEDEHDRLRRFGLDAELVSPEEASELNPFLESDGVLRVMRVGDDMYFDPAQVAIGFVRGAEARGARLAPQTTVTGVRVEERQVTTVETDDGPISTGIVVDAAGAWTRQVAAASGIRVPLVPTRHQLVVTEPVPNARADLPMVRIMDAAVYVRPCEGGFLWGGFEEGPRQFDMDELGPGFGMEQTPLDLSVLRRMADQVRAQLPVLSEAPVKEHRGGLPTMTADGRHILGPVPAAEGFYVASGCNVAGLSASPAIGELLAAWIVDGEPPLDLTPLSIERFAGDTSSEDDLRRDAARQYHSFYVSA
jgi:4-methylaminobutanoate oxidase (formaldehyde-forming)